LNSSPKFCECVLKVFLGIGQMLCEECGHFLEIANVIRSLDLVILRGFTETQGEKTWICFVTEVGSRITQFMKEIPKQIKVFSLVLIELWISMIYMTD